MKLLVIGGGGREHALVWKLSQSPKVDKIYCAPGSAGIAELAECVAILPEQIDKLAAFAEKEKLVSKNIDLLTIYKKYQVELVRLGRHRRVVREPEAERARG